MFLPSASGRAATCSAAQIAADLHKGLVKGGKHCRIQAGPGGGFGKALVGVQLLIREGLIGQRKIGPKPVFGIGAHLCLLRPDLGQHVLLGQSGQRAAIERFQAEYENVRTALRHAVAARDEKGSGKRQWGLVS